MPYGLWLRVASHIYIYIYIYIYAGQIQVLQGPSAGVLMSLVDIKSAYRMQITLGKELTADRPVDIEVQRLAHSLTQPHQRVLDLAPLLSLDHRCTMPGSCVKRRLVCKVLLLYLRRRRGVRVQGACMLKSRMPLD